MSKYVEVEDVENVARGVILQCLVGLLFRICMCNLFVNCFHFQLLAFVGMKKGIRRFRCSHLECSTVKDPECIVPFVQF